MCRIFGNFENEIIHLFIEIYFSIVLRLRGMSQPFLFNSARGRPRARGPFCGDKKAREEGKNHFTHPLIRSTQPASRSPAAQAGPRVSGASATGRQKRWQSRSRRKIQRNFVKFQQNLLVFGCIGTNLCKQVRVFQHFQKL